MGSSSTLLGIHSHKKRQNLGYEKTNHIDCNSYKQFQTLPKIEEGNVCENIETSSSKLYGRVERSVFIPEDPVFLNKTLVESSDKQNTFRRQEIKRNLIEDEQYMACNTKLLTLRIIFFDLLLVVCNLSSDIIHLYGIIPVRANQLW